MSRKILVRTHDMFVTETPISVNVIFKFLRWWTVDTGAISRAHLLPRLTICWTWAKDIKKNIKKNSLVLKKRGCGLCLYDQYGSDQKR